MKKKVISLLLVATLAVTSLGLMGCEKAKEESDSKLEVTEEIGKAEESEISLVLK